ADARGLDAWARAAGASPRTLARLFAKETGLTFRAWRQRARLLHALVELAARKPVTSVAFEAGYDSPSAFIAAFKREFGTTPARYFQDQAGA
ncbi:MAG: helix-turn-helix transcriptional regulator, partial [Proteobacteria bacterium]|nr:helix-turn-helix transcriptional regulator [Pseudomonadota bacterium]